VFATFDPEPLAAASIGQAHAATMPDGRGGLPRAAASHSRARGKRRVRGPPAHR
jgi:predicted unusual protein kinase regulating ubiquinone biosynthesis (AarF/ABC1/UbiB family)